MDAQDDDMNGDKNTINYALESGTATVNNEDVEISACDLTIDTSTVQNPKMLDPDEIDTEYSGSFSFSLDEDACETVVCPGCNTVNTLLPGVFLGFLTCEPVPCIDCGYPLL